MKMGTEDEIDLQVIEIDKWREQKPGVQVFLNAARHIGQDDPLDGPQAIRAAHHHRERQPGGGH